jgi:hypothetical protein
METGLAALNIGAHYKAIEDEILIVSKNLNFNNPWMVDGDSRIRTIKYGLESRGTQTRAGLRWRGKAVRVYYRPVPSSERALQNNKPATV